MNNVTDAHINKLLSRGILSFIDPQDSFKNKLIAKAKGQYTKDIIIKFGVDPTRPDIHLGHAVVFKRLREFQDLGCKVVFLIGDVTAQIGDPTGKSKVRPELEQQEVEANMKTYLDQVGNILRTDEEAFSWIRNSDWFTNVTDIVAPTDSVVQIGNEKAAGNSFVGKAAFFEQTRMQISHLKKDSIRGITLVTLLSILRKITHARLIERDMFQDRINNNSELYMHEMMYPVLQGIDSMVIAQIYGSCDLEVGGSDQTFNMLMGRDVMKNAEIPEQSVLSFDLLVGTDGKEKMSKSLDNYVSIIDSSSEMYGKIMSIPDSAIVAYFKLCTDISDEELEKIKSDLTSRLVNPKHIKVRLAKKIVSIYFDPETAEHEEFNFDETFKKGKAPEDIEEIIVTSETLLSQILIEKKLVKSKSELRTLILNGAVTNLDTSEKIDNVDTLLTSDITLKIGKHRFLKIKVL